MSNPLWSHESEPSVGRAPDSWGQFHGRALATWTSRAGAGVIDYGLCLFLPYAIIQNIGGWVLGLVLTIGNSGVLAAMTTQSLGKRVVGIQMVRVMELPDGTADVVYVPIEIGVLRIFLHALDTWSLFTGWIAPAFTKGKGTYADYLTRTLHFRDHRLPHPRQPRGGMLEWPGQSARP